jgi:hypothetical protein
MKETCILQHCCRYQPVKVFKVISYEEILILRSVTGHWSFNFEYSHHILAIGIINAVSETLEGRTNKED